MKWANFFHLYQPADQQPRILEAVTAECYRPLLTGFIARPEIRLTLNVAGALLELFDRLGHHDIIDLLRTGVGQGSIELTGSAKYHAFLPLLEEAEIVRQIAINTETLRFFFGKAFSPRGFFPPEMAYMPGLERIVKDQGFEWMLLDEIARTGKMENADLGRAYAFANGLRVCFRERRTSNLLMSAIVRSAQSFREAVRPEEDAARFLITGMDGETFGHHRPGLEQALFDILGSRDVELLTLSEFFSLGPDALPATPVASTWASSSEDIAEKKQFLSWSDPENEIHAWQWELVRLSLGALRRLSPEAEEYSAARHKMDVALASDHFWWASAKPWWSVEMIENGAYRLLDAVRSMSSASAAERARAAHLYEEIVSTAFQWQRSGKIERMKKERNIALRIPFRERTLGSGGEESGVYHAFLAMMRDLESSAAAKGEYEKAVLWRDAAQKLARGNDVYDAVNAIDLLRIEIPHEEVERTIERYKNDYRRLRGGQPEDRG